MTERCDGCRFWRRGHRPPPTFAFILVPGDQTGECRLAQPPGPSDQAVASSPPRWPRCREDDWCGRWEATVG